MDKILQPHSNKDRIFYVNIPDKQVFYYQTVGSRDRKYLFMSDYSPSVFKYFKSKGRRLPDSGFYLTIGDLYRFHKYHNKKPTHTLERVPLWVDFVLREVRALEQTIPVSVHTTTKECSDERIA